MCFLWKIFFVMLFVFNSSALTVLTVLFWCPRQEGCTAPSFDLFVFTVSVLPFDQIQAALLNGFYSVYVRKIHFKWQNSKCCHNVMIHIHYFYPYKSVIWVHLHNLFKYEINEHFEKKYPFLMTFIWTLKTSLHMLLYNIRWHVNPYKCYYFKGINNWIVWDEILSLVGKETVLLKWSNAVSKLRSTF